MRGPGSAVAGAVAELARRRLRSWRGDDQLYRCRRLLRRAFTTLNQREWTRLELTLTVGDPSGQLTSAWMVAQEPQLLYARSHDLTDGRRRLWRIWDRCAGADVHELLRLARTLDACSDELLAY